VTLITFALGLGITSLICYLFGKNPSQGWLFFGVLLTFFGVAALIRINYF
jgi:hypothetical protein